MRNSKNLVFIILMAACTQDVVNVNSRVTPYKIINSAHTLPSNGIILYSKMKEDGNFEFYTYDGSVIKRTAIDAHGNDQNDVISLVTGQEFVDDGKADSAYSVYSIEGFNTSSFLQLVKFGGPNNRRFLNVRNPQPRFDVEVVFGQGTQKALGYGNYLNLGGESDGNIAAITDWGVRGDFVDVPFQVWDVTNHRQLMASFHDQDGNREFNLVPLDTTSAHNLSEEYIVISNEKYESLPPPDDEDHATPEKYWAYSFWPVLSANAFWDPAKLPMSSIKISFDHYVISANFDYSDDAVRNSFINGNELVIFSSDNSGGFGVQGVSFFDQSLSPVKTIITTHQSKVQIATEGLFALRDGSYLAGSRVFNDLIDSVRFVSLNSKHDLGLSATINTSALVSKPEDFRPVFVETDDARNIFILYDKTSLTVKWFEVSSQGISPSHELSNCGSFGSNYPVDILKLGSQYILLFNNGQMELLDGAFNCIRSINDFHQFGLSEKFRMYSDNTGNKIFYGGIVWDNFKTSLAESKLVLGYISVDPAGNVQVTATKPIDFGEKILGHYSCLLPNGGAATLVQIQRSLATTDLIFFQTDESLNTAK